MQAEAFAQPGDDVKVAGLKAETQKAIEAGDLAKADALLANVESEQRRMRDCLALNLAETSRLRADIASLAYGIVKRASLRKCCGGAPFGKHSRGEKNRLSAQERLTLFTGREMNSDDNDALCATIERARRLIALNPRERSRSTGRRRRTISAMRFRRLGNVGTGTERLEEAVAAYRAAL